MLQPAEAGMIVQVRPAGSASVKVSPVAVPVPVLLTLTSKPMVAPAATGPVGLAVLVTARSGHWTVTVAVALLLFVAPFASLLAEMEAVLEITPQLLAVVNVWTCTEAV